MNCFVLFILDNLYKMVVVMEEIESFGKGNLRNRNIRI